MSKSLNVEKLEREVRTVYRNVAEAPTDEHHFEMGRSLAERLGYPASDLDRVPAEAIDSFAGVGYHLDLDEDVLTARIGAPFEEGHLRPQNRILDGIGSS